MAIKLYPVTKQFVVGKLITRFNKLICMLIWHMHYSSFISSRVQY